MYGPQNWRNCCSQDNQEQRALSAPGGSWATHFAALIAAWHRRLKQHHSDQRSLRLQKPLDHLIRTLLDQLVRVHQKQQLPRCIAIFDTALCNSNSTVIKVPQRTRCDPLRFEARKHSFEKPRQIRHQNHWLWLKLLFEPAHLLLHSIEILQSARDYHWNPLHNWNWYVVVWMHLNRALHRNTYIPWREWDRVIGFDHVDLRIASSQYFGKRWAQR